MKELLIGEGIYPHLIHFFVEGDTEEIVLNRLLPLLGYEAQSGMTVTNIRGIDKAQRYSFLFSAATEYAARTVFVGDIEGEIERTLQRLRQARVFTDPGDVLLWETERAPSSFEEANLSYEEILAAIQASAAEHTPGARLTLTADELRAEFARRVAAAASRRQPRPGLANVALALAREERYGAIHATKTSLAPHFADTLEDAIRRAGHLAKAGNNRPLLARLWYWLVNTR